jgi:hypothetical protein
MNYLFVFLMSGLFFNSCACTELKDKQVAFQKVKTIYKEVSAEEFKRLCQWISVGCQDARRI